MFQKSEIQIRLDDDDEDDMNAGGTQGSGNDDDHEDTDETGGLVMKKKKKSANGNETGVSNGTGTGMRMKRGGVVSSAFGLTYYQRMRLRFSPGKRAALAVCYLQLVLNVVLCGIGITRWFFDGQVYNDNVTYLVASMPESFVLTMGTTMMYDTVYTQASRRLIVGMMIVFEFCVLLQHALRAKFYDHMRRGASDTENITDLTGFLEMEYHLKAAFMGSFFNTFITALSIVIILVNIRSLVSR